MAADTGVTAYPADDDLNLPSDKTIPPKSAGDGHYTFIQLLQRLVGFCRAIYADYLVSHKPNPNAHHNRQHSVASASDHLFDADVLFGAHNVSATLAPTLGSHLTNKAYVDGQVGGARDPKESVRVATAAALPAYTRAANIITANANGALPNVDGVALAVGDRLLLKDGASGSDNGLYTVTSLGSGSTPWVLTRAADMDLSTETTQGAFTWAVEGTVNGKLGWLLTTPDPIALNTTAQTWTQIAGLTDVTAGAGLTKTGNQLDVVANADGSLTVNADDVQVTPGKFSQALTPTAVKTANYGAAPGDFIPVDTTSGAVTITLPTAPADKTRVAVKLVILGGSNAVTINAGGADVFNKAGGGTSLTIGLLSQALNLQYKASSAIWYVVADDLPLADLDARFVGSVTAGDGTITIAGTATAPTVAVPTGGIASAQIADGTIVHGDVAAANKDGVAATPSMRSLGTGAQQAAAGNDIRFQNVTVVLATNAAWPIPAGATVLRITAVGGGGQGGGGGANSAAAAQAGGAGGGAGATTTQIVAVGANTTLNITIGAGGSAAGVGGAAGSNAGTNGSTGGNTTVTATGISITAGGGGGGTGGSASSSTVKTGGVYGTASQSGTSSLIPGNGAPSAGFGVPGPSAYGGTGGAGGANSSTTNGGLGGNAGTPGLSPSSASTGSSGTSAGGDGGGAAANSGCGGGGGGGGTNNTGKGGDGGHGGSGYVIIEVLA